MTLEEQAQVELWKLESKRPLLEFKAKFYYEIKAKGLRPTQVQFNRWWRRVIKYRTFIDMRSMSYLLKAVYLFTIRDLFNREDIFWKRLKR